MYHQHSEQVPGWMLARIAQSEAISCLEAALRDGLRQSGSSLVCSVVLRDTPRDALFYHLFLCSLLCSCRPLPQVVVLLDDVGGPFVQEAWYPAHLRLRLSSLVSVLPANLRSYGASAFFYRIYAPVLLAQVGIESSRVLVCDNDVIAMTDFAAFATHDALCAYSRRSDSRLAAILGRDYPSLGRKFLDGCRGAYGDFAFSVENTQDVKQCINEVLTCRPPGGMPSSAYAYFWLQWLRIVNTLGAEHFRVLLPAETAPRTYCDGDAPVLYHLGGGYEKSKVAAFLSAAVDQAQIFALSPLRADEVRGYLLSHDLLTADTRPAWLDYLEQSDDVGAGASPSESDPT